MRGQQGECGAAREGCRSARACATLSPPRWTTRASAAAQGRTQSTAAALVHLHPQNAHSSALLARWAGPMSTAVTARPGAPFAQTVSLLQRAPLSRRIPAPKGAITCSPGKVAERVRKSCALPAGAWPPHHGRAALPRPGQARPGLLRLLPAGGGHRMTCRAGLRGFLRGGTLAAKARPPGVQERSGPSDRGWKLAADLRFEFDEK